jgi:hypothetical protein
MPCPPRSTVPVNQERGYVDVVSTQRVQFAFGHGGDHSSYVALKIPNLLCLCKRKTGLVGSTAISSRHFQQIL